MVAVNPRERDTTRAYRIFESRVTELEAVRAVAAGTVELASDSSTTTTVPAPGLAATDLVALTPTAASSTSAGAYVSAVSAGEFTVTHAASASPGRTFTWMAVRA